MYCGQTVRWIKMQLGTEVGLGPGHIVLDDDPTLPSKGHSPSPQFSAHICCGPVNSSHGQLVTRSSRHTVNSSLSSQLITQHGQNLHSGKNRTSVSAGLQMPPYGLKQRRRRGLRIAPKCVCRPGSARTRWGSYIALPQTSSHY